MSELDKITKIYLLDLVMNFSSNRGSERSLSSDILPHVLLKGMALAESAMPSELAIRGLLP